LKLETGKWKVVGKRKKGMSVCGKTKRKSRIMDFNPKGGEE
jgi:hypothetical protein